MIRVGNEMIVGVDTGYAITKGVNFSVDSKMTVSDTRPMSMDNVVEYNGKFYSCGTGDRVDVTKKRTHNEFALILTLLTIAKELKGEGMRTTDVGVNLAVGLPLEDYQYNQEYKNEFKQYFQQERTYNFKVDDEKCRISIKSVSVHAQGYSAILPYKKQLQDKAVLWLLDIGGHTSDTIRLEKFKPQYDTIKSYPNIGTRHILSEAVDKIRVKYRAPIFESQVEDVLLFDKKGDLSNEMVSAIKEIAKESVMKVIDTLKQHQGYREDTQSIVFCGGGAKIIENLVNSGQLGNYQTFADIKANVIGYEKIREVLMLRDIEQG